MKFSFKPLCSLALMSSFALLNSGCGKVYNSSTFDSSTYGAGSGTTQFLAAKAVIKNNCSNCHTRQSHEAWAGMSERDFVTEGLVTPGSLIASSLYTKIIGNRTDIPGNMPLGSSVLTEGELVLLETWIETMAP